MKRYGVEESGRKWADVEDCGGFWLNIPKWDNIPERDGVSHTTYCEILCNARYMEMISF